MQKFSYPVCSTKEEFDKDWKLDGYYGDSASYGFHEGIDVNLKTGGNTDSGKDLLACLPFKRKYYHYNSHLTSGFGKHTLLEVVAPFNGKTYWLHYAHMLADGVEVSEGDVGSLVGHIGATGRPKGTMSAHLHFSVFKKLPTKLDMIAANKATLEEYWVDPLWFFNELEKYTKGEENNDQTALEACLSQHSDMQKELETLKPQLEACKEEKKELEENNSKLKIELETERENLKDCHANTNDFMREMVGILDPNTCIEIADPNLVKNLAKLVVQQFSDIQSELKKKTNAWSVRETELLDANAKLKDNLTRITQDVEEIAERHAAEMIKMQEKHALEIDVVKKHLDKVTADAEKLEEQQIENDKVKQFIEVIKSFFERKK